MLQITAEQVSPRRLQRILKKPVLNEQILLIAYCFKNYREGAYVILRELEREFASRHDKQSIQLIEGLRRSYYDKYKLMSLVSNCLPEEVENIDWILRTLEDDSKKQVKMVQASIERLVPLMIEFPLNMYRTIDEIKRRTIGSAYTSSLQEYTLAEEKRHELLLSFKKYEIQQFTGEDYLNFLRVFGLYGHVPLLMYQGQYLMSDLLVDKLGFLIKIFNDFSLLTQAIHTEIPDYFAFIWTILMHMTAFKNHPEKYQWGLGKLTYAISTKGKLLELQPTLPSLLKSLKTLVDHLNHQMKEPTLLNHYPIFVFDQSEDPIFLKNNRMIEKLNNTFNSQVVHISLQQALNLAHKLGIHQLIETTPTGQMGYAGARNCVFFLAPVLKHGFLSGCRSIEDVLNAPSKDLSKFMQEFSIGGINPECPHGESILMIDDDVEIAESNLFSHALFLEQCGSSYSISSGYCSGRLTKLDVRFQSLEDLLRDYRTTYSSISWFTLPTSAVFSECVSKSLLCFNLPFGNEENQFSFYRQLNPFLQTSIHLGGTRFPKKHLPTHFFVGLEEHLKTYIPYSLHIAMISDLLDPLDKRGFCIFPWRGSSSPKRYSCLRELLMTLTDSDVIEKMQISFWRNVSLLLYATQDDHMMLQKQLLNLLHMDSLKAFKQVDFHDRLLAGEKRPLRAIDQLYQFYRQDAGYLFEYMRGILEEF